MYYDTIDRCARLLIDVKTKKVLDPAAWLINMALLKHEEAEDSRKQFQREVLCCSILPQQKKHVLLPCQRTIVRQLLHLA